MGCLFPCEMPKSTGHFNPTQIFIFSSNDLVLFPFQVHTGTNYIELLCNYSVSSYDICVNLRFELFLIIPFSCIYYKFFAGRILGLFIFCSLTINYIGD